MENEKELKVPSILGLKHRQRNIFTLVFIEKGNEVLLGFKKRGFGKGLWNGFGGKVILGESIIDAAAREIQEECNLVVKTEDLKKCAIIIFEFLNDPVLFEMHVFRTDKFSGQVEESDEMMPKWFSRDSFPQDKMWVDSVVWHPFYFERKKFTGYFLFEGYTKVLSYVIRDSNNDILLEQE